MLCPRCGAARGEGPECLHCGVIFAKYRPGALHGPVVPTAADAGPSGVAEPPAPGGEPAERAVANPEDETERWVRVVALPAALAASWLLMNTGPGHFLGRVFCGMWLHELGHAVTAWLCGYHAVPGPWFTPVVEDRSWVFGLMVTAMLAWLFRAGWARRSLPMMAGAWTLFLCQIVGSLVVSPQRAKALVLFGGDAGGMLLGTLCMTTLYAAADSSLRRHRLRFGFLAIGAIAFMDAFVVWWAARTDPEVIPFGENEGQGLTDPTRLVETYGWTEQQLVTRYVAVGAACLLVLALLYVGALQRGRRSR